MAFFCVVVLDVLSTVATHVFESLARNFITCHILFSDEFMNHSAPQRDSTLTCFRQKCDSLSLHSFVRKHFFIHEIHFGMNVCTSRVFKCSKQYIQLSLWSVFNENNFTHNSRSFSRSLRGKNMAGAVYRLSPLWQKSQEICLIVILCIYRQTKRLLQWRSLFFLCKVRRSILLPFFCSRNILNLEPFTSHVWLTL